MKIIGYTYLDGYDDSIFNDYLNQFTKQTKIDVEVIKKGVLLYYKGINHYVICDSKEKIVNFLEGIKVCGMNFMN